MASARAQYAYACLQDLHKKQQREFVQRPGRHKRRGGWNPKARRGHDRSVASGFKLDQWVFDSSKSQLWLLFNDNETYDERSFAGAQFYDQFAVSHASCYF